ncbi:MAG TPA: DNA-binding response regulator [Candidatus Mediterraneibacter merdipullorum]|nr:DNA-binding response regulator [Candidatus Mediterraneibacter merdipullorum]
MRRINGDQLAQIIRDKYPRCQIIFTTASQEHAVKAFKIRALDYLVKPYTYEELECALDRFEEVYDGFLHYIELKEGRQFLWCYRNCMVNMDYITAVEDKDFVLTDGKRIPISRAMHQEVTQAYANYMFEYVTRGSSV